MCRSSRCLGPSHVVVAALMMPLCLGVANAQTAGKISGVVSDDSGALIPGATATLRNHTTGLMRVVTADQGGRYEFLAVPVGEGYSIEFTASNFRTFIQTNIALLVNQAYKVDVMLKVGGANETISVSSSALQVDTTSTQMGQVIQSKEMTNMPLNGRSFVDLLALQPGVVPISSGASNNDTPVSGNLSAGVISVNGAREDANAFLVNGADVEESRNNGAAVIPNLDSIQEFRVLTDTFDAEYGRFSGGIVNVVTKSGTNALHGTVFEFLRNDALDARNYFNAPGVKGTLKRNQFGGAGGGPILKDRIFFFTDYQGTRQSAGVTGNQIHVPSPNERAGNFSDVGVTGYSALSGSVRGGPGRTSMNSVLSTRLGYTVTNGEPYWVPGCNSVQDGQAGRCVFPGQVIPQGVWSPAAKGMLQYIPTGSQAATPLYSSVGVQRVIDDKLGERGDIKTTHLGDWALYYFWDKTSVSDSYGSSNPILGFGADTPTRAQNASLSNTLRFGSTAVNEAEISFTRFVNGGSTPTGGRAPGTLANLGFMTAGNGIIPSPANFEGVPNISLQQLGFNFGMFQNTFAQTDNTYAVQDSVSKVLGRHSIKFGGQYKWFQTNELLTYNQNGSFNFTGGETGNDFADYLLGAPDSYTQASPGALAARSKYMALYAQDSFKLTPNLTMNFGLRWDVSQPWSDTQDRLQTFIPGQQSTRFPTAPLGWNFPGDKGVTKSIAPARYNNFAPRFGIAYSPSSSNGLLGKLVGAPGMTSIRAGFGLYYTAYAQIINQYELGNSPFAIFYVSGVPVYLEQPFTGRQGNDPGQRFPYVAPANGAATDWSKFQPVGGQQSFLRDNVTPYNEQFNFNVQRQIGKSLVATVAYVGTNGRHLIAQVSGNPGSASTCLTIAAAAAASGTQGCGPFGEDTIYNVGAKTYNGTRPYSVTSGRLLDIGRLDFAEVPTIATFGSSSYNALQASAQKVGGNFQILGSYTYSKALDNMSGFLNGSLYVNPFDHRASYGLAAFDVRHNFVASYSYNLPLQRLVGSNKGVVGGFLSGWQVSGITRLTTGVPIHINQSGDLSLCGCEEGGSPNYAGGTIHTFDPRREGNQYFAADQFTSETLGKFGTARHSFFSGPGLNNTDMALQKFTRFGERVSWEFRAEFFNVFNHAQFNNPGGDYNSSNFGIVRSARDPRIGQVASKISF
jgi:hypothetical protein